MLTAEGVGSLILSPSVSLSSQVSQFILDTAASLSNPQTVHVRAGKECK